MKLRSLIAFAILAAATLGSANAATFVFKGDGNNVTPLGTEGVDYALDCGTIGFDYCTVDESAGLNYSLDGIGLNIVATANSSPTKLVQDITPEDSGLGALSEGTLADDQTQFDSGEAIEFTFDRAVIVTDVEFNAGNDVNCSNFGDEGPCGDFALTIDGMFQGVIAAVDLLAVLGTGTVFLLEARTPGAGFSIAQFNVLETPIPAALPLLLSGLFGLGFAARRKKNTASAL